MNNVLLRLILWGQFGIVKIKVLWQTDGKRMHFELHLDQQISIKTGFVVVFSFLLFNKPVFLESSVWTHCHCGFLTLGTFHAKVCPIQKQYKIVPEKEKMALGPQKCIRDRCRVCVFLVCFFCITTFLESSIWIHCHGGFLTLGTFHGRFFFL